MNTSLLGQTLIQFAHFPLFRRANVCLVMLMLLTYVIRVIRVVAKRPQARAITLSFPPCGLAESLISTTTWPIKSYLVCHTVLGNSSSRTVRSLQLRYRLERTNLLPTLIRYPRCPKLPSTTTRNVGFTLAAVLLKSRPAKDWAHYIADTARESMFQDVEGRKLTVLGHIRGGKPFTNCMR